MKTYYIAIERDRETIYIYRTEKPEIGAIIEYNGQQWKVTGYMPVIETLFDSDLEEYENGR